MQFHVYPHEAPGIPFLLDVQSDLIASLNTRVVVPLYAESAFKKPLSTLTPTLTVRRRRLVMVTPELAGIGVVKLGEPVENLAHERHAIVAALDLLFTGI